MWPLTLTCRRQVDNSCLFHTWGFSKTRQTSEVEMSGLIKSVSIKTSRDGEAGREKTFFQERMNAFPF